MDYLENFISTLTRIAHHDLNLMLNKFTGCINRGGNVFVMGNGGSAAIADHFCCDFNKGSKQFPSFTKSKAFSFSSSQSLVSALNNDFGTENIFSWQLEKFTEKKDLVILISSSGNSPNILAAADFCEAQAIDFYSLVGMGGGALKEKTGGYLLIESHNYGIIEDSHMAVLHMVCQEISKLYAPKTD